MRLLAAHVLGDFLLQNRWLARGKQSSVFGMFLHCFIYASAVCLAMAWWDLRFGIVFGSHFLIDYLEIGKDFWPELMDQGDPNSNDPAPMWLRLVMDQSFHFVSLALIQAIPVK